jgi:hypothetical protein
MKGGFYNGNVTFYTSGALIMPVISWKHRLTHMTENHYRLMKPGI